MLVKISIWIGKQKALNLPANPWLDETPNDVLLDMANTGWVVNAKQADRCLAALRRNPEGISQAKLDAIRRCQAELFLPNAIVLALIDAKAADEWLAATPYGRTWPGQLPVRKVAAAVPEKLPEGFLMPRRIRTSRPLPDALKVLVLLENVLEGAEGYVAEIGDGRRHWPVGVLEEARRVIDGWRTGINAQD